MTRFDTHALIERWSRSVDHTVAEFSTVPDAVVSHRPAPGTWSTKEIIGHLIDSAVNNHRRFVLAQIREGLTFDGYEQDEWVACQRYQDSPWPGLLMLWAAYNRHLMQVAAAIPAELLNRPQTNHNFYEIASRSVPAGEPTTLGFFIEDYVWHLEHHIGQLRGK